MVCCHCKDNLDITNLCTKFIGSNVSLSRHDCNYVSIILYRFRAIISYFPKFKEIA